MAAAGDIACAGGWRQSACHHKATSDLLLKKDYTAVLVLGDNQYPSGSLADYNAYFHPTWGRVKGKIRPVPGNHEYYSGGSGYYAYFGAAAHGPGGYYSYDLGSWHLIALNSAIDHGPDSPQVAWLKLDLAANSKPCVLAYWHHARFSSGSHGDDPSVGPFWSALYAARADVVLSGHDHNYQRFALMTPSGARSSLGIRQFVVGTGGASHYAFSTPRANLQASNATAFGILDLNLYASSYSWRFVPEAGKTYGDSGSMRCH